MPHCSQLSFKGFVFSQIRSGGIVIPVLFFSVKFLKCYKEVSEKVLLNVLHIQLHAS